MPLFPTAAETDAAIDNLLAGLTVATISASDKPNHVSIDLPSAIDPATREQIRVALCVLASEAQRRVKHVALGNLEALQRQTEAEGQRIGEQARKLREELGIVP